MDRPVEGSLVMGLGSAARALVLVGCLGGSADDRSSATSKPQLVTSSGASIGRDPRYEPGVPTRDRSARVLAIPRIGTVAWRCDSGRRPPRFSVSLAVPSNGNGLDGRIGLGNRRPIRFTVDPGKQVATRFDQAATQRWTIVSHHPPATLRVQLAFRFRPETPDSDCDITKLTMKQAIVERAAP